MGSQPDRTAAVAAAFPRSWAEIAGRRGWWPDARQVECARLLREARGAGAAVPTQAFVVALGASLRSWKAFRGVPYDHARVERAMRAVGPLLSRWEGVSILRLRPGDGARLFELFEAIGDIKPSVRKWVVTSKTLYHLLPDLIVPMDNLMTAPFLGRSALPSAFEAEFLSEAYAAFVDLARRIGPAVVRRAAREVPHPVSGAARADCRLGVARVVDLAIAGYVLHHGGMALRSGTPLAMTGSSGKA